MKEWRKVGRAEKKKGQECWMREKARNTLAKEDKVLFSPEVAVGVEGAKCWTVFTPRKR